MSDKPDCLLAPISPIVPFAFAFELNLVHAMSMCLLERKTNRVSVILKPLIVARVKNPWSLQHKQINKLTWSLRPWTFVVGFQTFARKGNHLRACAVYKFASNTLRALEKPEGE